MSDNIDIDISHYSINDILKIFNLDDDSTEFQIKDVANALIAKMISEKKPELSIFFEQMRDKLIEYINKPEIKDRDTRLIPDEIIEEEKNQIDNLWNMNSVKENNNNTNIEDDDTNVRFFTDKSHVIIERVGETKLIRKEAVIAKHLVTVDSQFRTNILPYIDNPLSNSYSTNFTFFLSNPINRAVTLELYSYQIPTTWYSFSARAGNTFFSYNGVMMIIPDGNYTPASIVDTLNNVAAKNIATSGMLMSYDTSTKRISITNNNTLSDSIEVIFYIKDNTINYNNCGVFILSNFQTYGVNTTLGYLLGFHNKPDENGDIKLTIIPGESNKVTASTTPDTYGPKYFVLSIEEFSNKRLTSGLYNIKETKKTSSLSVTDYFKTINVECKLRSGALTQSQLYAIDAITDNNTPSINTGNNENRLSGPTNGSAFAIIPLDNTRAIPHGDPYTKFGADLNMINRNYLSPTRLERLNVRLLDDKGNLVNLYDSNWSFSLIIHERLN